MKRKFSLGLSIVMLILNFAMLSLANAATEYVYSDTIDVVEGVEVHYDGDFSYWMEAWPHGKADAYLTHDAYTGHGAMLIVSEEKDGKKATTSNFNLQPSWGGGHTITQGKTYKFSYMIKPLELTNNGYELEELISWYKEIDANYDAAQKVKPTYYDPETNQVVSGNFESKWYRAEAEIQYTFDSRSEYYGMVILSASTFLIDDIITYERNGDSWTELPECGIAIDTGFETHANKDYTVKEPVTPDPEYVYSDTIDVVEGVEVHYDGDFSYWMEAWPHGKADAYLTHDAYTGHGAMLIVSEEKDGKKATTSNFNLQPSWGGGHTITQGKTYKFSYMIKPLELTNNGYELEELISWYKEIDANYDAAQKVKPTYYDPETNQVVSGNFESKWYRAEAEIQYTFDSRSEYYGMVILSASTFLIDDIITYERNGDSWTELPECGIAIDTGFETHANKDYTVKEPVTPDPEYVYPDTIGVISGVEVFQHDNIPHWWKAWQTDGGAEMYLTRDSYSENAALLIDAGDAKTATTNVELSKDLGQQQGFMREGDTIRIEFMVKPLERGGDGYVMPEVRYYDNWDEHMPTFYDAETGEIVTSNFERKWYKAVTEITLAANHTITWYGTAIMTTKDVVIDNVRAYQLINGEYEFIPEWYAVRNGSFEEGVTPLEEDEYAPDDVENLVAVAGNSKVELTWDFAKAEDVSEYIIFNGTTEIARVGKTVNTYVVEGLVNGTEYTLIVKAMDEAGNISQGSTVKATPIHVAYEVVDGVMPENVVAGNNTVSMTLKNNTVSAGQKAELILALYDKTTKTLVKVVGSGNKTVEMGESEPFSATMEVMSPDNYILKAFLWESLTNVKPLIPSIQIGE